MLEIPGYTHVGTLRVTGSNKLFQAMREADGLSVILKSPSAASIGPAERERYRREFAILQRLQDVRGVIRPHGCELVREHPVLILEEVRGTPLSESTGSPFDIGRFLDLATSLAETLSEVHLRGVIHKDIKPSNIIITPSGEARLIDFGAATLQREEHVDAVPAPLIEGTPAYMSPEQTGRMSRPMDYRTDLYSLGVTFYELLTGGCPFRGRDVLEWFHAHIAQAPRPPHELNGAIPEVLSAIVMKLLAKAAEERYQSASGLKADLDRCREELSRGRSEPFPLGTHDAPGRFQLPRRLYGRASQVAALLRAFERVASSGRPELLLVSGYSGSGKSSLVRELHRPVVQRRGFFLSGKFDQFQRDIPYATLAQAIRGLVQHLLAGTDEQLARWRERLREAWKDEGQVLVEVIPQLELVVGRQPVPLELPPGERQGRLSRVFQRFLGVFASLAQPLVVFLDDLQWADLASLQLLQSLLTQEGSPPVLWIGAFRDNEVSPTHPLMSLREVVRGADAKVLDIHLEPLSLEETRQLVIDALPGGKAEVTAPLSALLHEKTAGNPFFLLQLLLTLNQDGLLSRTPEGGWQWDAEGVRAKGYSDNVVDFLVRNLHQLPASTRRQLCLAACVGSTFPLSTLTLLSGLGELQVEQDLEPALQEGLLARSGLEQYRFLHDRIQQAAHALMPEEESKAAHLRIGRLLLSSLSPAEVHERLFDIVGHLSAGAHLITDPAERHRVARLEAEAGFRAKAASAHGSAVVWLRMALALIPGDPWETDHELAFQVQLERAGSELMCGNTAEARRLAEELPSRVRSRADIAAAYGLKNEILLIGGEIEASVTCLLECLTLLGMPMSAHPSWDEVVAAHDEVQALLGDRPIESLIDLPPMTDPDAKVLMGLLSNLFASAYFTDHHLLALHLCRMVSLTLRYGNTDAAAHGYGWYGVVLSACFKQYRKGHAFGLLACEFAERNNLVAWRGKALFSLLLTSYWNRPLATAQEIVLSAFQHSVQASDYTVACYCCVLIIAIRLEQGHDLAEVYQESVGRLDFVRKGGFVGMRELPLILQRYVQQLRGFSDAFDTMSGEGFNEQEFDAALPPALVSTVQGWYQVARMQSRFMCGSYKEALAAGDKAASFLWAFLSNIVLLDFHLYRALALAACHEGATEAEQRRSLEAIELHRRQLEEWEGNCPRTFRAPERMVRAELARLKGRLDDALRAYEEAIRAARESGAVQNVGLASELAANFYRTRQAPLIADAYAREARAAYLRWGAHGKVRQLDRLWPHLALSIASGATTTSTGSTQIDALSLVKAQQAISSEIVLERLVSTLMQVAIENAGAWRGALLLPRGDRLEVAASAGGAEALSAEEAGQVLPWTIIAYVKRTREHVLIDDASSPHPFSSDPALERGGARSVLCLPLLRQEAFSGVLYLENNLASGAFTPTRISLLQHLASQAAISIENARLYADVQRAEEALRRANDDLEQRVEERTRELKQAQARLVESARTAGMAEVASNVLHNVGNVLSSAITNLELMREAAEASRGERMSQVAALFEQHRGSLATFLTQDPRGSLLPEYFTALARELSREREVMRERLDAMSWHMDHIRAIVQMQQASTRSALHLDVCDLSRLFEDALRMQMAELQSEGITVTRELASLPEVRVDKHRVLQILVNLISNARHAVEELPVEQRHLRVRLGARGGMACLQVTDTGVGIAPEIRQKLFSHGFTTRKDGHGFGLHSSALAAQLLGGRLLLESEGPGKGATATLELPLP